MTKITQYGLTGIFICLALGSYLNFLAQRDTKMLNYYGPALQQTQ